MCADRAMWLVSVLMLYDDVDFAALIVTRFYSS